MPPSHRLKQLNMFVLFENISPPSQASAIPWYCHPEKVPKRTVALVLSRDALHTHHQRKFNFMSQKSPPRLYSVCLLYYQSYRQATTSTEAKPRTNLRSSEPKQKLRPKMLRLNQPKAQTDLQAYSPGARNETFNCEAQQFG